MSLTESPLCGVFGGELQNACDKITVVPPSPAEALAASQFDHLVEWIGRGAAKTVQLTIAGWISVPSPNLSDSSGSIPYLTAALRPITYTVLVLVMVAVAGKMALDQRGEDAKQLGVGLLKFLILCGLGTASVSLLTEFGDQYSNWILDTSTLSATGETAGLRALALLALAAPAGVASFPISSSAALVLYTLVLLSSLAQIVLIYVRAIVLVLLLGMLPIAAAAGLTRTGRPMLDRYLAWGLAWLLWKPVAATVYAAGFYMMGTGGSPSFVAGLATLGMAVFALPALLRVMAPMTAALGSGGGGGSGAIAAGAAASGAIRGMDQMLGSGSDSSGSDATSARVRDATDSNTSPSGAQPSGPSQPSAQGGPTTSGSPPGSSSSPGSGGADVAGVVSTASKTGSSTTSSSTASTAAASTTAGTEAASAAGGTVAAAATVPLQLGAAIPQGAKRAASESSGEEG